MSDVRRTIIHLFEVRVGRGACRPKRVENFLPQTTAHVAVHRKQVDHKCQKRGRLLTKQFFGQLTSPRKPSSLSAYGFSRCDKESDKLIANMFNIYNT
jgi:predicted RNA-binding Zn ribbon-like protein